MEKFEVNILGCGAAIPIGRHMTTSQLVNVHDNCLWWIVVKEHRHRYGSLA